MRSISSWGARLFTFLYIVSMLLNPLAPAFAGGERIIVMQVQGKGLASDEKNIYRSALVGVLGGRYEVLSGDEVDKKVQEIFQKESAESMECDAEKCMQEIAIALQADLVATCTIVKRPGGYLLNFQISNVLENRVVFADSQPCKDCDEFRIIGVLKAMAGGKAPAPIVQAPSAPVRTGNGKQQSVKVTLGRNSSGEARLGVQHVDNKAGYEKFTDSDDPDLKGDLIVHVFSNTAAEKAGLKAGDIITHIGKDRVRLADDLNQIITGKYKPNDVVTIQFVKGNDNFTTAVKASAHSGSPAAQYFLGAIYLATDRKEAVKWIRKSAEQGNASAQNMLASFYYSGEGVRRHPDKGFKLITKSAEQGDALGQYSLGQTYYSGYGRNDKKESVDWFRKSAEQGFSKAQYKLGSMYSLGVAVKQDSEMAFYWYLKSAEGGNQFAQYAVAAAYENGRGASKDKEKAIYWYRKAAEWGGELGEEDLKRLTEAPAPVVGAPVVAKEPLTSATPPPPPAVPARKKAKPLSMPDGIPSPPTKFVVGKTWTLETRSKIGDTGKTSSQKSTFKILSVTDEEYVVEVALKIAGKDHKSQLTLRKDGTFPPPNSDSFVYTKRETTGSTWPEGTIKEGDTWEQSTENIGGNKEGTLTTHFTSKSKFKVLGFERYKRRDCLVMQTETITTSDVDMGDRGGSSTSSSSAIITYWDYKEGVQALIEVSFSSRSRSSMGPTVTDELSTGTTAQKLTRLKYK